jgi:hypothetical protein
MKYLIAVVIAVGVLYAQAQAATFNVACNGNISSSLQSAIGSARAGDTVAIGAGNCSMSAINISDKNIIIIGAGQGVTNITAQGGFGQWITNGSSSPNWRLSSISLSGTG